MFGIYPHLLFFIGSTLGSVFGFMGTFAIFRSFTEIYMIFIMQEKLEILELRNLRLTQGR